MPTMKNETIGAHRQTSPFFGAFNVNPSCSVFLHEPSLFDDELMIENETIGNGTIRVPSQKKRENGKLSHLSSPHTSENPVY